MSGEAKIISGLMLGVVLFLGVLFYVVYVGANISCRNTGAMMGVPYQYNLTTDCLIKPSDRWIPLKSYRYIRGES